MSYDFIPFLKSKKIFQRTFIVFLLAFSVTNSSADQSGLKIRVGIFQNEPIVFIDDQGRPQGLYIDLLSEIARQENWSLEYIFGSWSDGLLRLREHGIELLTSIAYSNDRDIYLDFSEESVLTMWGQVYTKENSTIGNIFDLGGLKLALVKDEINGIFFQKLLKSFGVQNQILLTDTYEEAVKLVMSAAADACVINNVHGYFLEKKYNISVSSILFNPFRLVFAVPSGENSKLLTVVDQYLREWKKDKDSFFYETIRHWYPDGEPARSIIPAWVMPVLLVASGIVLISIFWVSSLLIQIKRRNRAEKALEESKNFLASVFDSIQDGISILDRDMNVVRVNKVMHEWYPDVPIFTGKKCYQVYHGRSSPCTVCPTVRALVSNKLEMNEIPLVRGGHEAGILELYAFPILDSEGHATGVVEYIRDITTRKNAEKEREKLIEKLQSALDEIKTLRGILPVCCYCKNIRDDKGYWDQIESYISKHSEATFSHGICPNCMKEHFPELYESEQYKKIQQDRKGFDALK